MWYNRIKINILLTILSLNNMLTLPSGPKNLRKMSTLNFSLNIWVKLKL